MSRSSAFARRAAPLLAAGSVIAGCSADRAADESLGSVREPSVCASGAVVKGVDVSVYQGTVDWPTVKATGIGFAIARVSDGTYLDTQFDANWAGMKAAGLVRGAYQFFEPGQDPVTQADLVVQKVGVLAADDLPVVADMEVTGGQSSATIVANLQTWVDRVRAGTGKSPMIYTAVGFWDGSVGSTAFGALPLWAANWGVTCPSLATGWSNWQVWQYADNGSVNGIAGAVDLDEFNGDLTALHAFAGAASDWGAQFVSQSWPLASTTMTMTVNQVLPATITLKNVGAKSWDANTRLATSEPRDRTSPFASADWVAPNRLAAVTGSVAPGQDFAFSFRFHAPSTPGTYDEFFGVVEEGTAWFSDPGQGGPTDNQIEAKIQVVEAEYHGALIAQSFPTLQQPAIQLTEGQSLDGTIELKNVGTATWKAGVTELAPTPRDKPSPIGASNWLGATRVSSPPTDVPPGQSYAFPVRITGVAPGDYTQTFSLVEEGVTWFADAPKGGGPSDDLIAIHVIVTPTSGDSGVADSGLADAGPSDSGADATSDVGSDRSASATAPSSGCSCIGAGDHARTESPWAWLATSAMALVVVGRRRRR